MNRTLLLCLFIFVVSSCSSSTKNTKTLKKELVRGEEQFSYTDKNGQYIVKLSAGFNKKEKTYFTRKSLEVAGSEETKILEQSVVLSDLGSVKKHLMLRPKISQYNVWFEGKKYFSELKMNPAKKAIDVKMVSPESQWNGTKQIKLPSTHAVYCFFSQVVECAKTTGFITQANKKENGAMNFYVVWEGYPYLNETFTDFPTELISKAQFVYEGKTKEEGERRYSLKVAGQSIFYVVDKNEQMKKMFWISQGISMVSKLIKKEKTENSNEEFKDAGGSIE